MNTESLKGIKFDIEFINKIVYKYEQSIESLKDDIINLLKLIDPNDSLC